MFKMPRITHSTLCYLTILAITLSLITRRPAQAAMNSDYQTFLHNQIDLPEDVIAEAKKYRWVFVAGYLNRLSSDMFDDQISTLNSYGIQVHVVRPDSTKSFDENASSLANLLEKDFEIHQQQIIAVGHSKGALEVITAALTHPELIEKNILARAIAMQGPLAGNLLYDVQNPLLAFYLNMSLLWYTGDGFLSLQTTYINNIFNDRTHRLRLLPNAVAQEVSKRILYVTSHKDPRETPTFTRLGALSMHETHLQVNDGLVATSQMYLPEVGSILGLIEELGHIESVKTSTRKKGPTEHKLSAAVALTKALILNTVKSLINPEEVIRESQNFKVKIKEMNEQLSLTQKQARHKNCAKALENSI